MYAVTKPISALALTLAVTAALACTGEIDRSDTQNPVGGAGSSSTSGGSGGGPLPAACDLATSVNRAPMRRLTRFEYNNTVRDLKLDSSLPANAFPSEESGNGFGNDADAQAVVAALAEQYVTVAEKVAAAATAADRIELLAPCTKQVTDAASETACSRTIADTFTPKAWRRALLAGEADSLVTLFQGTRVANDFPTSVATMLEAILQSPEFIYRPELGMDAPGRPGVKQPTGYEMATRLSYLFWGSAPDDPLLAAAAAGQLSTAEGVRGQAERLLADPKTREVVRFFFDNLLPISSLASLERDKVTYPTFNAKIGSLLRTETQTFLENEIFSGPGTWPGVFTAPYTYVNQELAAFYGLSGVTGEAFQKVTLAPETHRAGLLTQAGVLAGPVHTNHANPVVRGSFVLQKLICQIIPKPTGAIAAKVTPPDPMSGATARQRFTVHSTDPVCRGCHTNMDPLGYGLENFDVVGLWRDQENGVTIDATGTAPVIGTFNGPIELGQRLAESEAVQQCFTTHWLNFGYGRTLKDAEACGVESVRNKFKESGYNVQQMLLALTQAEAFLTLPAVRE
jgi:hypothetical protein